MRLSFPPRRRSMRACWDSDRIMTHLNYLGTIITRQMAELAYRPAWGACYRLGAMIFLVLPLFCKPILISISFGRRKQVKFDVIHAWDNRGRAAQPSKRATLRWPALCGFVFCKGWDTRKPFTPPPQLCNPQFLPLNAKYLTS